jgi:molybdopterin biosynthesis enzyme
VQPLLADESPSAGAAYRACLTGTQSSGAVSSILKADGLAIVPDDRAGLEAGSPVAVLLLST